MEKIGENLVLNTKELNGKIVYTDRNGVYNGLKLEQGVIKEILDNINQLNKLLNGKLKIISNESEDNRQKVLKTDIDNGLLLKENNYNLSTQSAVKFILNELGSNECYFIGNNKIGTDIKSLGLNTINISCIKNDLEIKNIPILFARPPYAINARYNNDKEIDKFISKDISLINLEKIIETFGNKVIFCHTKQNCFRNKNGEVFREINLGYYYNYLLKNFGYINGKNIFDLGKGNDGNGSFFNMALGKEKGETYNNIIGIGDIYTDIEYNLKMGGIGILVNSGDGNNIKINNKFQTQYKNRFFNINSLSNLKII